MKQKTLALIFALMLVVLSVQASPAETAKSPGTLTYWANMSSTMAQRISSLDENLVWKTMQEKFDVDIEFIHPAVGSEAEAFNLMLASRDFADIIEYQWSGYNGGPEKAIQDEVIIDLSPYLGEEIMPNLYAYLAANENIRKQVLTDNRILYCFPCINTSVYKATAGYYCRGDLLAASGVGDILTTDDMTAFLRFVKEVKGAQAPLSMSSGVVLSDVCAGAFGVGYAWYVDDGEIKFGPFEENYRAYIQQYADWYAAGLLDPDFVSLTTAMQMSNILSGESALTYGYIAGGIGNTLASAEASGQTCDLKGLQFPRSALVEEPYFTSRNWDYSTTNSAAVTVACEDAGFACALMDYFYGEEGNILKNFGIKDYTYNLLDGKYVYSDTIMNDPVYSYRVMMAGLLRCDSAYPGFIVQEFHESTYQYDPQGDAIELWQKHNDVSASHKLPQLTPTLKESNRLATITVNVDTFMKESIVAMIMGLEDIDTFYDVFVAQLRSMKADDVTEIYSAAYQRYISR